MTPIAISRRTTIPLEIIEEGIRCLEQPDPDSRSPLEEGRRIVRISDHRDWGWMLVNHKHYHSLRSNEERRAYMKEYMQRRREGSSAAQVQDGLSGLPLTKLTPLAYTDTDTKNKPLAHPGFVEFWASYPRKKSKGDAIKAWNKLKPNLDLVSTILDAIYKAKGSPDWLKDNGQFIPYPASWLNARGWEDEITRPASGRIPE
jgi:hypothetical protein